jgi:hypothetical protein
MLDGPRKGPLRIALSVDGFQLRWKSHLHGNSNHSAAVETEMAPFWGSAFHLKGDNIFSEIDMKFNKNRQSGAKAVCAARLQT